MTVFQASLLVSSWILCWVLCCIFSKHRVRVHVGFEIDPEFRDDIHLDMSFVIYSLKLPELPEIGSELQLFSGRGAHSLRCFKVTRVVIPVIKRGDKNIVCDAKVYVEELKGNYVR